MDQVTAERKPPGKRRIEQLEVTSPRKEERKSMAPAAHPGSFTEFLYKNREHYWSPGKPDNQKMEVKKKSPEDKRKAVRASPGDKRKIAKTKE